MRFSFTKMQGLGNDFVVIDNRAGGVRLDGNAARRLADRRFGVGCDQILLIEAPRSAGARAAMRILNADGGEVEQCGNGARCVCAWLRAAGLAEGDAVVIDTGAGPLRASFEPDGQVTVDMGPPRLEPSEIPFSAPQRAAVYPLEVAGERLGVGAASMGNPHAVLRVDDVASAPVATLGPAVQAHPAFPNGVNVGFLEVRDRAHVRLRVYERGAGETLACGTGACAAVVVGREQGLLDERVEVALPGGRLRIAWAGDGAPVWMTGPATRVFEGTIEL